MNDTELDQLLNTWEAPAVPHTMRAGLRDRFPRAERRRFVRPLRWVLVGVMACATLAVGMQQTGGTNPGSYLARAIRRFYEGLVFGIEVRQASALMVQARQSQPKVYVDGQLQPSAGEWRSALIKMQVPGEGEYGVMLLGVMKGFVEAGSFHGNVLEFQAGSKQVRIELNKTLVDGSRPVYVNRLAQ